MPIDNPTAIAVGSDVRFPQDGSTSGSYVVRTNATTFSLNAIGTYLVLFQVGVTESGQLILTLDSGLGAVEQGSTVVGRATGTNQIVGISLVTTTAASSSLTVRNPLGNSTPLNITALAGGFRPVSAHLTIMRIA